MPVLSTVTFLAAMWLSPPAVPCSYTPVPFDVRQIKAVPGVRDAVVDSADPTRVAVFTDKGDVVKLHDVGCYGQMVEVSFWAANPAYRINDPDKQALASVEKSLIQRAKIVPELIFHDASRVARIEKVMDGGSFHDSGRNGMREFSDKASTISMQIQQPPGGQDALIRITFFDWPVKTP